MTAHRVAAEAGRLELARDHAEPGGEGSQRRSS
jgi:hypothetical protein